jgi:hypothetical protein
VLSNQMISKEDEIILKILCGQEFDEKTFRDFEYQIFSKAKRYGVSTQIFSELKRRKIWSEIFYFDYLLNLKKIKNNFKALKSFAKSGFDFILLKGFSVAQKYYGGLQVRHAGDIDLLIKESDKDKFLNFLLESGFSPIPLSKIKEKIGHAIQFKNEDISVGVHTWLCDRLFVDIKYEDVETEFTKIKFKNEYIKVKTLSSEWDLIELSCHLFQHAFPLRIFLDISKVILNSHQNSVKLIHIAEKFKVANILLIGVLGAVKVFGLKEPNWLGDFEKADVLYSRLVSSFVSSHPFICRLRDYLFRIPYQDKIFALSVALKFPFRKMSILLPYFPKEFIKRLKGEYITTN